MVLKDNIEVFENLRDTKIGETVILIGNGPSLADTDLELIKKSGVDSVAMNRISLKFKDGGWRPTWYFFSSTNVKNPVWGREWTRSVREAAIEKCGNQTTSFIARAFQPWSIVTGKHQIS